MNKDSQFYFDMVIFIVIVFAIYYLRGQATGEGFTPFEELQSILSFGG